MRPLPYVLSRPTAAARSMTSATNVTNAPEILMVASATGGEVVVKPGRTKKAAAAADAASGAEAAKPKAKTRPTSGKTIDLTELGKEASATKAANGVSPTKTGKASGTRSAAAKSGSSKTTAKSTTKASPKTAAKPAKAPKPEASAAPVDLEASADALLQDADGATDKATDDKKAAKALASIKVGPKGVYTEDSIRVYLQEIGRIRLLRPDEEIELARKIADLLQLEELAAQFESDKGQLPDMKEWAALVDMPLIKFRRRLMLGRRAKEKMVQSNLRLVVSIAKKYMNRGLSFQDLIQEGSLGLIRAAEKFDHEKGYKFSTYATWWIRQAITRAIADQSRTIRLPVHLYETISRIKKTTKTLSQEFGRKPTEEEIAESMEMTIEKLRFIAKSAQLPISLETPIGKEEDSRLGDFIEADIENPEQDVAKNLLREDLEGVLATLSPRERDVLRLRYGLDDGRMKTLEEIGQIFDVTRERIRQIEAKALRKLRHPNRNGVLKEYIK